MLSFERSILLFMMKSSLFSFPQGVYLIIPVNDPKVNMQNKKIEFVTKMEKLLLTKEGACDTIYWICFLEELWEENLSLK